MSGYSRVRKTFRDDGNNVYKLRRIMAGIHADTAFHAVLPNGKVTVAFLERKNNHLRDQIKSGTRVDVCICPADFERARIDAVLEKSE